MRVMNGIFGCILHLFVILTLLAPSVAFGQQVLYRCHMDGQVHRSCCCEDQACPSPTATLKSCGCCSVEIANSTPEQPARVQQVPTVNRVSMAAIAAPLCSANPALNNPVGLSNPRLPVAYVGPPPFLRFCSFLI